MVRSKQDPLGVYLHDQEAVANRYVMKCFTVTMVVFSLTFILNLIGVFVIEQRLMLYAFFPSLLVYLIVFTVTRLVPLSRRFLKYFILSGLALFLTIIGIFLTYHVIIVPILLFLCATLYSSKRVMRYAYLLTITNTLLTVYGGYYFGLCDANMALLTTTPLQNYVVDGQFTLTAVNSDPLLTLLLFFVVPRVLIYIAFAAVCSSIFDIVRKNVEKAQRAAELERFQAELERKVREQTEEIRAHEQKLEDLFVRTTAALTEAVDAKDHYTSGHSARVAEYAVMIAARMGKSPEEQKEIYRAGLLHDIGKIRIPAGIINKPGRLTDEEYNLIKIHPPTGYHILREISSDGLIAVAAKHHHERYDGGGYPNGLSGKKIPEIARIIGVADAYDAMTSHRSYRAALPQDVVRGEIINGMGTQFDPDIAKIMVQMIDEDRDYTLKQAAPTKKCILTIDSDLDTGKSIADIMSGDPLYEVTTAQSADAALALLEQHTVHLILLDLSILKTDGQACLAALRAQYQGPVVLLSSDNTLDISTVLSEYGCDDYITKPFLPILAQEIICSLTERPALAGISPE